MGDADLRLALELADIADALSLRRFREHLQVDRKPDGSIVTDADRAVEVALRQRLTAARPSDAVLGEEFGQTGEAGAPRRWVLDPIDGTRSFVRGYGSWTTLIALERDGRVEVGVVSQPAHGRRWWAARGLGAWSSERGRVQQMHVSAQPELSASRLCDDYRGNARWGADDHPGVRLAQRTAACRAPHDKPLHVVVAEGRAELGVQQAATWDFAPFKVLVEEAGGRFTDLDGRDRIDTGSGLSSNGLVHDQALRALSSD
jgi:histidinol-phosphatase